MNQSAADKENQGDREARIVLFDGVCNLCNASVRFVIRNDPGGLYRFAHLQSPEGARLAAKHGIDPRNLDTFVLIAPGGAATKSEAWLSILDSLGGFWRICRVFRLVPRGLRDAVYDRIGSLRYRLFGRSEYCRPPDPEVRARFLDATETPTDDPHGR